MKKRVAKYLLSNQCTFCLGKRLRRESLSVKFAGYDIADISRLPLLELSRIFEPYAAGDPSPDAAHPEKVMVVQRIATDFLARIAVMLDLGLGYLTIERSAPTLSPGELQRLRLATQVRSNLFGVVYVLDEPSAGLHPADTEALLRTLNKLKESGNTLFIVEHELDVIRKADWIVDVGPAAGELGGHILYSGLQEGLKGVADSVTRHYLFDKAIAPHPKPRKPADWLRLEGITRNNLHQLDVSFPLGVMTAVTGVSGSGKSSLVSQALVELVAGALGQHADVLPDHEADLLEQTEEFETGGKITAGMEATKRIVVVDQKPIGRTPRSNLATYTGLFDHVRKLFAATPKAKERRYDAGRFSFNVAKGRCKHCEGEGFVMVELLFLPSVYSPCPTCGGTRFNAQTLEVTYKDKNIAEVLNMTVNDALVFFDEEAAVSRALSVVQEVGLGYLRLGQPATELSGGEAQRIKLATELQRIQHGNTLYILDEPTTGLHPSDTERLTVQLNRLVDAGNTVIMVEHDMQVIAGSDWVIDMGPGAGDQGGKLEFEGTPAELAKKRNNKTGKYLSKYFAGDK